MHKEDTNIKLLSSAKKEFERLGFNEQEDITNNLAFVRMLISYCFQNNLSFSCAAGFLFC